MAKFKTGDSVIHVESKERGIIKEAFPPSRGQQLYRVSIGDVLKRCLESNLIPDTDLSDPFERLRKGFFGSFLDFSRINTTFKIQDTSNNTISSLKASNTIFKAYQFKPLLKFLNSDNRRLLVADEVGLGKTIEAGHIMLELMARGELKNVLIVCPKSLQEKWEMEMKNRFNLNFKTYGKNTDLLSDLKERNGSFKAIVNYEKVRFRKDGDKSKELKKDRLFDLLEKKEIKFDFILCDEAHRLRNHTTQTHQGIKKIIEDANSVVFLTATPIMISEENLFNLLQLLDEYKYSEYATFKNEIAVNAPFIKALIQLNNNVDLPKIASDLNESEISLYYSSGEESPTEWKRTVRVKDLFNDIPLYSRIISVLTGNEDNAETRVKLQFDLSDMSEMNKIFSRTRKKEVTQDWSQAVREPHTKIVELYPQEREEFDRVIDEYIDSNSYFDGFENIMFSQGRALGLIQKKRQIASSVYGYLNTTEDLVSGIDRYSSYKDSKLEALLNIIHQVVTVNNKKLIVFATFIPTLRYLGIRLKNHGIKTIMIHGLTENRVAEIERFRSDDSIQILLSSEVGSEGLDMQFCDAIVNYDLPWNPMVVEQRIGRIDRFGQESPVVNIYNLLVKDSIQEDIYTRLLDRIGIFRGCIGDLEAILDKDLDRMGNIGIKNLREWISSMGKELYCTKISKEDRQKKISAIERAIIVEQRNLEEISEGLTNTLTNDIYFKNEIENIRNNHRYVTEKELVNYLRILILTKLTTCNLEPINEDELQYRLVLPKSSPRVLINFLNEYQPNDPDSQLIFKQFINSIRDKNPLELTFSQELGYKNKKLIRINAYHPIVLAAMYYFETMDTGINNTFKFAIDNRFIDKRYFHKGDYFLAVYKSTIIKKWFSREQKMEILVPIIYDLDQGIIIKDRKASESFLGEAQINASAKSGGNGISENIVNDLEYVFAEEIDNYDAQYLAEQKMRLETHRKMQIQRKTEFYDNRISRQEKIIRDSETKLQILTDEKERKNIESILPAQRKNLLNLIDEKETVIKGLEAAEIKYKTPRLLSLNYVTVY